MTVLKYFILIFILKYTYAEDDCEFGINVGTVLFTESDDNKRCWSNEQLALLRSRFVFQDVLPDVKVITMENDKFVSILLNYFRMAMHKVKSVTSGKTKQIHLMALTDAIGGYLHHVVIPLSNRAYYMGHICFESAEKVKELYDEIKTYLRTDGRTWTCPLKPDKIPKSPAKVKRASPTTAGDQKDPCSNLVYSDYGNGNISIPTPFLDSKTHPTSVAVPLKNYPLHNIRSSNSVNILSKFYDMAMACLKEKKASQQNIDKFNKDFGAFVENDIIPHTDEEELYPAFGGVFPLREATKHGGHYPAKEKAGQAVAGAHPKTAAAGSSDVDYYSDEDPSTTIMFIAVAVVILIWIITGLVYCCCRMRRKKKDVKSVAADAKSARQSRSRSRSSVSDKSGPIEKKLQQMGDVCPKPPKSSSSTKKPSQDGVKTPPSKTPPPSPPDKKTPPSSGKKSDKKKPPDPKKPEKTKPLNKKNVECRPCSKCNKPSCKKHKQEHKPSETKSAEQKSPPKTPPHHSGHHHSTQKTSTTVGYALGGSSGVVKGVQSAPLRLNKQLSPALPEQMVTSSSTSTEKPVVYGYDFTTTSDSSSFDESGSYSGSSTPKKI